MLIEDIQVPAPAHEDLLARLPRPLFERTIFTRRLPTDLGGAAI
jgi:hypothetical protein